MTLAEVRAAMKDAGYKSTVDIDRFSVNRVDGKPTTIDLMFTDGNVATIPANKE